jgi:fumarylacetoacetate (FAA) hydrolase
VDEGGGDYGVRRGLPFWKKKQEPLRVCARADRKLQFQGKESFGFFLKKAMLPSARHHRMKFVSLKRGGKDGQLAIVSRDLSRVAIAEGVAGTLQELLDHWDHLAPKARQLADSLDGGRVEGAAFDPAQALSPLPRAWQWLDGSAFASHGALMQKVFKLDPLPQDRPLMYQGMSDRFIAPLEQVALPSEADGIDFEGEFGVVLAETRMGATVAEAASRIRLLVLINDWSLRQLAPIEMKTGFGWVQAKPACSMAPVAITPDELGPHWRDGRVALPLSVYRDGALFGKPDGFAMQFSFGELVAHAARTRVLCSGTIIGSGTVSNSDARSVGSCCIAERRALELLHDGVARTPYLRFGERVRMECLMPDGASVFGAVDQLVTPAQAALWHACGPG